MIRSLLLAFFTLSVSFSAENLQAATLTEGHYESSGLYCAYNVAADGEDYLAEADHSSRLSCRDAGVVLTFPSDGSGHFLHDFGTTAYEWTVMSETAFVERVKVLVDGRWNVTNTIFFRLID